MANYVLIHGGQRDGSVWDAVAQILEKHGHRVFAPSLSKPQSSTLGGHISQVCKLMEKEDLSDVVLVGHSYASFVITGAADRMPEKIRLLIYVDCSIPQNGKSLYGMFEFVGLSSEDYELPQDPPFLEPLYFDEELIRKMHKIYVHCTRSEFLAVGKPFFEQVVEHAKRDNWEYFQIESDHPCMISHPGELADILLRHENGD
jgi:pimeloyl-ACP methyl ester carboxylesterase